METMTTVWNWLNENAGAVGALLVIVPISWSTYTYLSIKRTEQNERRFRAYHDLIKQLVEGENPHGAMRLDRQIAVIFELRNFKEYYPVTLRILRGLKESWGGSEKKTGSSRLGEELDETIAYIERKI